MIEPTTTFILLRLDLFPLFFLMKHFILHFKWEKNLFQDPRTISSRINRTKKPRCNFFSSKKLAHRDLRYKPSNSGLLPPPLPTSREFNEPNCVKRYIRKIEKNTRLTSFAQRFSGVFYLFPLLVISRFRKTSPRNIAGTSIALLFRAVVCPCRNKKLLYPRSGGYILGWPKIAYVGGIKALRTKTKNGEMRRCRGLASSLLLPLLFFYSLFRMLLVLLTHITNRIFSPVLCTSALALCGAFVCPLRKMYEGNGGGQEKKKSNRI